jgi:hypothetical protein
LKYDSRYQATSVEEAISFFDDLSLQTEYKPPMQEGTDFLEVRFYVGFLGSF